MAAQPGEIVFKNDGMKFVPAVLMEETGGEDEVYVLQGSHERMARRAPSDYEGGYDSANLSNGGMTWCTADELPEDAQFG